MSRTEVDVVAVANKTLGGENVSRKREERDGVWSGEGDAFGWRIDEGDRCGREKGEGEGEDLLVFPLLERKLELSIFSSEILL